MNRTLTWAGALLAATLLAGIALPEDAPPDPNAMMELMKKYGSLGKHHKQLEYFIGKWSSETAFDMGAGMVPGGKGEEEFRWQIPGRFLMGQHTGTMMNQPYQSFLVLGFDNFKKKFVSSHGSSMETALRGSEGVVSDPTGKVIVTYGTIDEYLTGEHDKQAKYVWRFLDDDHFHLEVYDLGIGESGKMVVVFKYTRQK